MIGWMMFWFDEGGLVVKGERRIWWVVLLDDAWWIDEVVDEGYDEEAALCLKE